MFRFDSSPPPSGDDVIRAAAMSSDDENLSEGRNEAIPSVFEDLDDKVATLDVETAVSGKVVQLDMVEVAHSLSLRTGELMEGLYAMQNAATARVESVVTGGTGTTPVPIPFQSSSPVLQAGSPVMSSLSSIVGSVGMGEGVARSQGHSSADGMGSLPQATMVIGVKYTDEGGRRVDMPTPPAMSLDEEGGVGLQQLGSAEGHGEEEEAKEVPENLLSTAIGVVIPIETRVVENNIDGGDAAADNVASSLTTPLLLARSESGASAMGSEDRPDHPLDGWEMGADAYYIAVKDTERAHEEEQQQPQLQVGADGTDTFPQDDFVVAVPLEEDMIVAAESNNAPSLKDNHHVTGYLMPVPEFSEQRQLDAEGGERKPFSHSMVLAVPGVDAETDELAWYRQSDSEYWPPKIDSVSVYTEQPAGDKVGAEETHIVKVEIKTRAPPLAWMLLVLILLAMSSMASFLKQLSQEASGLNKLSWRNMVLLVMCIPILAYDYRRVSPATVDKYWSTRYLGTLAITGVCMGMWMSTWIISMDYTTVAHSAMLANLHCIIIVAKKLVFRQHVTVGEICGSIISTGGAIMMMVTAEDDGTVSIKGDMLALASSFFAVGYFESVGYVQQHFPTSMIVFPSLVMTLLLSWAGQILVLGERDFGLSGAGLFGLFTPNNFLWTSALGAVAVIAQFGIVAVMKYFDAIIISVTLLLEPVFADLLAVMMGVEEAPALLTILSAVLLLMGSMLTMYSEWRASRIEVADVTKAATKMV